MERHGGVHLGRRRPARPSNRPPALKALRDGRRGLGVRLQIVLALSALLLLAFVPLFIAVASLTEATVRSIRESNAFAVARLVARHVEESRGDQDLATRVNGELGIGGVRAIGVYDERGHARLRLGDPKGVAALAEMAAVDREVTRTVTTPHGNATELLVPNPRGAVAAVLWNEDDSGKVAPLLRLLGLYMGLFALALLVFLYIALTRLIVRPLDAISAAARRVAAGARGLEVPERGPLEMVDLSRSLAEMTAKLRADEQRMRDQIDELERRAEKLRQAQDRLVRSERLASVGRLSAGLAHEIGNPLAALLGLEDLLIEGGLAPEEQLDFLLRIRKETERIHIVLRNLLDFARPGGATLTAAGEKPGDVGEAVADVVALVRPQPIFRDVTLEIEVDAALPPVTLGHQRMMQVLLNLFMNAADAAAPGRGKIRLTASQRGPRARLVIEDDGPGIHPSIRERLFEPFVTTKEVGKGTGLGLAVCRGLVESAQGTIHLDDSQRGGARFVVELPIASHPAPDAG